MWCHLFRVVQAKFETGMCEMKILGSEVLWCIFGTLVQDGTHAWCHLLRVVRAKFKRGMCEMKILGPEILWCVFRMGWLMSPTTQRI